MGEFSTTNGPNFPINELIDNYVTMFGKMPTDAQIDKLIKSKGKISMTLNKTACSCGCDMETTGVCDCGPECDCPECNESLENSGGYEGAEKMSSNRKLAFEVGDKVDTSGNNERDEVETGTILKCLDNDEYEVDLNGATETISGWELKKAGMLTLPDALFIDDNSSW